MTVRPTVRPHHRETNVFSHFLASLGTQYTVFINGSRAERPGFECLKARLGRPRTDHKTKQKRASDENARVILTEDDIPGASLAGRNPSSLKNEELKFWLRCRGDSLKGLKKKAQLVKR